MDKVTMGFKKSFLRIIKDATQYSGVKTSGKKVISASSVFNDDLTWVLKYKHGLSDTKWSLQQNTLGSLIQLGLDKAFEDHNGYTALRLEWPIPGTDFILSGELDHFLPVDVDGEMYWAIIDNKLVKHGKVESTGILNKLQKEGDQHAYSMQVRLYKFLIDKTGFMEENGHNAKEIRTYLSLMMKDGTLYSDPIVPDFVFHEINNMYTDEDIESILVEKANKLQAHIDYNITPAECSQKFWNMSAKKRTGKAVPQRCVSFCDVAEFCPYYKKSSKGRSMNALSKLMGL